MNNIIHVVLLLLIGCTVSSAQSFGTYVTPLDHTLATPRALALHNGEFFLAYDGGDVCRFDQDLRFVQRETSLDVWYIVDLIVHNDVLYACSNVGDLMGLQPDGLWKHIGRFDCEPFVDRDNRLCVTTAGELRLVENAGGSWTTERVGTFAAPGHHIDAFAVRGDTVIYSADRDSTLRFSTLQTTWNNSVRTSAPVERLLLLEDGSLGIEIDYRMTSTLTTTTLVTPVMSGITYEDGFIWLENARTVHYRGDRAILGRVFMGSGHPNNGSYLVFSGDSVVRLTQFDTLYDRAYQCDYRDGLWAFATTSYLGTLDSLGRGRHYHAYGDTVVNPYGGFAFQGTHAPYRTGDVRIKGVTVPAVMPSSELGSPLQVLDVPNEKLHYLRSYHKTDEGAEIGFTTKGVLYRSPSEPWRIVFTTSGDYSWNRVRFLSNDVIAWLFHGRTFALSTDAGSSWNQISVTGLWRGVDDMVLSSSTLFAASYDKIWAIDLTSIRDSITPPVATFQPAPFMRAMSMSDGTVCIVTGRSEVEQGFNPTRFTHFQVYQWDPNTGRLDSSNVRLTSPITAYSLQTTHHPDTLFVWSDIESRLVAITRNSVAYDTTISTPGARSFLIYSGLSSYTDVNGTWWLINEARNYVVSFNPSRGATTSVVNHENEDLFTVSPNPAGEKIHLRFGAATSLYERPVTIKVVDLFGTTVVQENRRSDAQIDIDISSVPSGMYLVVVADGTHQSTTKVAIAH